jgi:hypothetical protein
MVFSVRDDRDWLEICQHPEPVGKLAPTLQFDDALRFLGLLDADADKFLFSAHDDDKERAKAIVAATKAEGAARPNTFQSRWGRIQDAGLQQWMLDRQAAGWGITVCVQAMSGGRRLTADVAYVRAIFGEMDREPLKAWPLTPSVVVETSPGRCHCYWLTFDKGPITERDFHGIMMHITETYGSDPSAKDLARTLRLPGTWNLKPDRPRHLCRIVHQSGARYSRDELLAAFPPPPERPRASAQTRPKWNGSAPCGLESLAGPLKAIPAEDYGVWLRVGMALHHESGGSADGLTLWDRWSSSSPKWAPGVCAEKWGTFGVRTGVAGGTIMALAKANGWHPEQRHDFSGISRFSRGARLSRADDCAVDPLPLVRPLPEADPFPVEALGPIMAIAALAFHAKTQAPIDICANAVLAVAGLVVQAHGDVQLPTGAIKPLCLYLVTIARSGERKTSTDNLALAPVRDREAELRIEHEAAAQEHRNDLEVWEAERKAILKSKKDRAARKLALDDLGPEPKPPLAPILVCHEPTFEGLVKLLIHGQPSVGIFASEGGAFIGGYSFSEDVKLRTAAGLSMLWDDGSLTRVRAEDGASALAGRRVALHLQLQPDVAARLFADPVLLDQGFLSRVLVVAPESLQGRRFWRDATVEDDAAARAYVARLNELLRRSMPLKEGTRNELKPKALPLSAEARARWTAFSDEVESQLVRGGALEPISGLAAKLAEHAARIAAHLVARHSAEGSQSHSRHSAGQATGGNIGTAPSGRAVAIAHHGEWQAPSRRVENHRGANHG